MTYSLTDVGRGNYKDQGGLCAWAQTNPLYQKQQVCANAVNP